MPHPSLYNLNHSFLFLGLIRQVSGVTIVKIENSDILRLQQINYVVRR